jgi:Uma2 family endonuclease
MEGNLARQRRNGEYTYEDYLSWEGAERCELIDGCVYLMAAPNEAHHDISMALARRFGDFLEGKPCKLFVAPFDVRLFPHSTRQREKALVQPDLFVVCDRGKRDGAKINGAPDLIIEILSPSNQGHDRYVKLKLYFLAGVREYWIVDPENQVVQVCLLEDRRYAVQVYEVSDTVPCAILPGLDLPLSEIFPREKESG